MLVSASAAMDTGTVRALSPAQGVGSALELEAMAQELVSEPDLALGLVSTAVASTPVRAVDWVQA